MTLDDQTDGGAALTRREHRRRTGAIPITTDADVVAEAERVTQAASAAGAAPDAELAASVETEPAGADAELAEPVEAEPELTAEAEAEIAAHAGAEAELNAPLEAGAGLAAPASTEADRTTPTGTDPDAELATLLAAGDASAQPVAAWADEKSPATALTWVDPVTVEIATQAAPLEAPSDGGGPDLLVDAPRRGFLQPGILVPLGTLAALGLAYVGTTLLWPLHELPPTIEATTVTPVGAEAAAFTWPADGSAAVSVEGVSTTSSTTETAPIASVTKVVSSLMVLEAQPLQLGEQGPEYSFDNSDSSEFWSYLRDDQSALDVPVGGVLTEYQMLQGILLGSANNYIDRLADDIWGSDRDFAAAAESWLSARGLSDITIVTPSGRNENNVASPASLTTLASIAMANPVFAEIVGTESVDLPGAGVVTNSNGLLPEPGFVGVKTGSLDGDYNLLSAKDVTVGDATVRIYAAVLGQDSDEARLAASRDLYTQVEAQLQAQGPAVTGDTVVGQVSTPWGASADVVTDGDASVVLWNSAAPTAEVAFDLGETRDANAAVGTMTVAGPVNSVDVPVVLASDLEGPSPWWRLTHPFELLGITD
ncbi:D-alanyl-D-alanine carboxypeptidase family protein [Microbacterium sp. GXF0217]